MPKVFVVNNEYLADAKVYIVDNEYLADIKVCFVDNEYLANMKVFIVDNEYIADMKAFVVPVMYYASGGGGYAPSQPLPAWTPFVSIGLIILQYTLIQCIMYFETKNPPEWGWAFVILILSGACGLFGFIGLISYIIEKIGDFFEKIRK